ncbi:MAG: LPXTG cell wall anchor domain-containing protein [Paludibacter sp.]|nr:LPXTG cell wall anchor domain-containing protein [Paludibacter sp.]
MKKLSKTTWIVIAGSALLIGIAGIMFYKKRKNALAMAEAAVPGSEVPGSESAGTTTAPATSPATSGTGGKFTQVVKDTTKSKAILIVKPKGLFKVGDPVKVTGKVYNGTYPVWYVYTKGPDWDNVYLDTPFISDDSGTAVKTIIK